MKHTIINLFIWKGVYNQAVNNHKNYKQAYDTYTHMQYYPSGEEGTARVSAAGFKLEVKS